jgi:hypothetical protein
MSNEKTYFDSEKQEQVLKWLEEKWTNRTCECCGNTSWSVTDFLVAPPRYEDGFRFGGKIAPQITAVCNQCGNTKFFNAVMMGLIDRKNTEGNNE